MAETLTGELMGRTLLRGAQVVTMAPDRPASEQADVLVDGSVVVELGPGLDPAGAEIVDLTDRVIIPGLVNAHLHTWQTPMRFVGSDWSLPEYLATVHGSAAHKYRPSDMHVASLAGALNQIDNGVTTIGDYCHNCLTPEHADAAIDGLRSSGVRAVFLHGTPHSLVDRPHDVRDVDRLVDAAAGQGGLISVGMAIKGLQMSKPSIAVADLRAAADRGIVASLHQSAGTPGPAWNAVSDAGLWGPLVNIVHGTGMSATWVERVADHGTTFTATTENELGQGHCSDLTRLLLRGGRAPSLGTDTEAVTPGEVLAVARLTLAQQRGLDHEQEHAKTGLGAPRLALTCKDALSWATVEGARALGLADRVGRIAPGMAADLVAIDTRMLNLWPCHDPVAAALHAHAGNIESVMIAGVWRKRDHALVATGLEDIKDELLQSGQRLVQSIHSPRTFERVKGRAVRRVVERQLRHQTQLGDGGAG